MSQEDNSGLTEGNVSRSEELPTNTPRRALFAFDDEFGDRTKSPLKLLEESFAEDIQKLSMQKSPPSADEDRLAGPPISIRFRVPPVGAPAHDVFGDALYTIFQQLLTKGPPAEFCHWLAYLIATTVERENETVWQNVKYTKGVYETEGTVEAKKLFSKSMLTVIEKIMQKAAEDELFKVPEKWSGMHISAEQRKGSRNKQEDRFFAYPNGQYMNHGEDKIGVLAVFDGHGGSECSQYAASHFWEEWIKMRIQHEDDLVQALVSTLNSLDERMTKRSEVESWKGGTTAVTCAIDMEKKEMVFAWLGDSAGFVMSTLEFKKVTRDHSPSDPEEARRVEEAGGQVMLIGGELRVNGVLNLTRALGDVQGRPMISNESESVKLDIHDNDYLVLLACDGVTDVFNTSDLYNLVEAFVAEHSPEEYNDLANYICKQAMDAGSGDNVTVVIGFLRHPVHVWNLLKDDDDDDDVPIVVPTDQSSHAIPDERNRY